MIFTRPLIFKSSNHCNIPLGTVPRAPITIGITVTFMFHICLFVCLFVFLFVFFVLFFCFVFWGGVIFLARSRYLSLLSFFVGFFFFSILLCGLPGQQSPQLSKFSFLVDYHKVWSSGRDYVIRLYLKIPEQFVRIILQDRFWVVHRPFVSMVKFNFLAQLPVDHLSYPVVFRFILFLS